MSDRSHIEWTDATWNPTRGCTKISPGCVRCYADAFARRFEGVEGSAYQAGFGPQVAGDRVLDLPLSWRAGRRIFVDSMSDLFHEAFEDQTIDRVVARMLLSPRHTFQVLTKRPARMVAYLAARDLMGRLIDEADRVRARRPDLTRVALSHRPHLAPWIWWGVSVEDRRHGLPRVAELRGAGVRVPWLSVEPLLEAVDLRDHLSDIRWVVVGGETGAGCRPCELDWVRDVIAAARAARVPVFVKQLGGRPMARLPLPSDGELVRLRLGRRGDPSLGPTDLQVREFPGMRDEDGLRWGPEADMPLFSTRSAHV